MDAGKKTVRGNLALPRLALAGEINEWSAEGSLGLRHECLEGLRLVDGEIG